MGCPYVIDGQRSRDNPKVFVCVITWRVDDPSLNGDVSVVDRNKYEDVHSSGVKIPESSYFQNSIDTNKVFRC